jgi:hypothetical protein
VAGSGRAVTVAVVVAAVIVVSVAACLAEHGTVGGVEHCPKRVRVVELTEQRYVVSFRERYYRGGNANAACSAVSGCGTSGGAATVVRVRGNVAENEPASYPTDTAAVAIAIAIAAEVAVARVSASVPTTTTTSTTIITPTTLHIV